MTKWRNENVYFVYGGTDTEQREKIRGFIESHKKSTTIATMVLVLVLIL